LWLGIVIIYLYNGRNMNMICGCPKKTQHVTLRSK